MSFGVSMTDKESDLAERIKVADNNLYAAKQQGRNKVVAEAN
jgi:PleD family two-component response regulator